MPGSGFMIYGAYGYTGQLIARQALARGHRPLLAGRDAVQLEALARELDLPCVSVSLEERSALLRALERVAVVCHAAGPFIHTSAPMLEACLSAGVSYLDITGEVPVFEAIFARHAEAERRNVALIAGVGFDVVPSDCLARFVASGVPAPTELELAIAVHTRASGGTTKASFEGLLRGNLVRRDGELVPIPLGEGLREVQFSDRVRPVLPIPWGDLSTAFRTTGIANITTYLAVPGALAAALPLVRPLLPGLSRLLARPGLKRVLLSLIDAQVSGPDARARSDGSAYLWARAANADGVERQAWLETSEAYAFTAESAVLALEALARAPLSGALTPAQAFGTDFVLQVSGSVRHERLPASAQSGRS